MQQGKKGKVFSFLWGLLLGSMPYSLLLLLLFSITSFPQLNVLAVFYAVLLFTWPIVLVGQLDAIAKVDTVGELVEKLDEKDGMG
jgi:hypothetical protein